jgi:F-type H+-transporting ATPase subunit b
MAPLRASFQNRTSALGLVAAAFAATPAAASGGGLEIFPQWTTTLPLLVVLFVILIVPANALLWQPLLRVLDQRRERIAGTRARAEKIANEAENVLASYQSSVERARIAAESDRAKVLESARSEQSQLTHDARKSAETEVAAARAAVDAALGRARADLQAAARDLGREAAARVLGRQLS